MVEPGERDREPDGERDGDRPAPGGRTDGFGRFWPDESPPKRPDTQAWLPARLQRRRDRIRAEIERNRAGNPAIPTWVLVLILVVLVAACVWILIVS
jgi:hypothetical protein